jgi:ABC-type transport system involved in multi-copper enzyme maturation permease subunit
MSLAIVGLRKFWTRTATFVSVLVAATLVGLEFVLVGVGYRSAANGASGIDKPTVTWLLTFPDAFEAVISIIFAFFGLVALIYVATASGSEWSWGTLKVAVTRGQSRWRYTVATFASLAIVLLVGMLIAFAAGIVAVFIGASIAGLAVGNPGDPSALAGAFFKLVRCWIALTGLTSVGYAVAMVAKSQMAGIGTVIGYFIASIFAPALLPDIVKEVFKYLPFSAAGDSIGIAGPATTGAGSTTTALDPNVALLITIGWLVGCLAVASISVERAEISG